jgi:hypothetical protein
VLAIQSLQIVSGTLTVANLAIQSLQSVRNTYCSKLTNTVAADSFRDTYCSKLSNTVAAGSVRDTYCSKLSNTVAAGSVRDKARKADNFTAISEPIVLDNVALLTSHNPIRLQGLLHRERYFILTCFA